MLIMGDVESAASSGDRRRALEAIRDHLARELTETTGPAAAVLSKELRAAMAELESLPGGKEVSVLDELDARRAARRADAQGGHTARGDSQ